MSMTFDWYVEKLGEVGEQYTTAKDEIDEHASWGALEDLKVDFADKIINEFDDFVEWVSQRKNGQGRNLDEPIRYVTPHLDEVIAKEREETIRIADMSMPELEEALRATIGNERRMRARWLDASEHIDTVHGEIEAIRRAILDATGEQFRSCGTVLAIKLMGESLNTARERAIRAIAIRKSNDRQWAVVKGNLDPLMTTACGLTQQLETAPDADMFTVTRAQLEILQQNLANLHNAFQVVSVAEDNA